MASAARQWLRTLVLRSNGLGPLRACNRLTYRVALRLFVRALAGRPGVASLYLSHGMAGQEWTPGLSDIDLTVILENGTDPGIVWREADRLQRGFPMIGEVMVFPEEEFGLWQNAAATSGEGRHWELLAGRATAIRPAVAPETWQQRALDAALWMYLESLPPCLAHPDTYLGRQDTARRVRKILRYVAPEETLDVAGDSAAAAACALRALEAAARPFARDVTPGAEAVMLSYSGRAYVVTPDGLPVEVLAEILRAHLPAKPAVLPYSLFAYAIRGYRPSAYARLRTAGTLISGADPLAGIPPPGEADFRRWTLERTGYLLAFTWGDLLHSTRVALPQVVLRQALLDGLAVQLLLREDWAGRDPQSVEARCRERFPEIFRVLDSIPAGDKAAAFALYRPVAQEMAALLRRQAG